ncbi:type II secretion system F family protein [Candidatus Woesearchaeota archaeon]|nr:type II secretion system F family protein [Candidatus Woesearchaeota archaeon]
MFKLPFSFVPVQHLRKLSTFFYGFAQKLRFLSPFLKVNLVQAGLPFQAQEYLAICLAATSIFFLFSGIFFSIILFLFEISSPALSGFSIAVIVSFFVFLQQAYYPKLLANKKVKGVEQNLLGALQNVMVQLNSGVPLFNILVNISSEDYGEVSKEFKKVVKEINAGRPQIEALEDLAARNPSLLFRRAMWQIVNGMKAGSNINKVIEESINALGEEQLLQIRNYGGQLNPLAMFYMLLAVIVPALSVTFITIISSFISVSADITKMIFWGLFGITTFFQFMFLGVIKSRRPNLLS